MKKGIEVSSWNVTMDGYCSVIITINGIGYSIPKVRADHYYKLRDELEYLYRCVSDVEIGK